MNMTDNQVWIKDLRTVLGDAVVVTTAERLDSYSYDYWPVAIKWKLQGKQPYRAGAVVRPIDAHQISQVLAWASARGVPVVPWGAGSCVTGGGLPVQGGLILDLTGLNRILSIDEKNLLVKVQAGIFGHELESELNQRGYTLNHSPQSLDRSSVGGWIATRAMGQFSSRWGGIEDLVQAFTVVLPTGEIAETCLVPRASVGPDIRHLFMGSEGTLGVVIDVTLKVFPLAEFRRFEAIKFANVSAGLEAMRKIMRAGLRPFLIRFYDEAESRYAMQAPDFSNCILFLGVEGLQNVAEAEYAECVRICEEEDGQKIGPGPVEKWMERRFDFSAIEGLVKSPGGVAETIEIAHFWNSIGDTYSSLKMALQPLVDEVLCHFSHVYPQGTSLYVILLGRAKDDAEAEEKLMKIWNVAMELCLEKGAALSHHHGIGLARLPYVRESLGSSALVLDRIKAALDPAGIMNPGKLGFG
jgi:alkyldihydroxyacetonephosphate synthase